MTSPIFWIWAELTDYDTRISLDRLITVSQQIKQVYLAWWWQPWVASHLCRKWPPFRKQFDLAYFQPASTQRYDPLFNILFNTSRSFPELSVRISWNLLSENFLILGLCQNPWIGMAFQTPCERHSWTSSGASRQSCAFIAFQRRSHNRPYYPTKRRSETSWCIPSSAISVSKGLEWTIQCSMGDHMVNKDRHIGFHLLWMAHRFLPGTIFQICRPIVHTVIPHWECILQTIFAQHLLWGSVHTVSVPYSEVSLLKSRLFTKQRGLILPQIKCIACLEGIVPLCRSSSSHP